MHLLHQSWDCYKETWTRYDLAIGCDVRSLSSMINLTTYELNSESNFVVVARKWFLIKHNNLQTWLRRMIWPLVKFRKVLYISCFSINYDYLRSDSNMTGPVTYMIMCLAGTREAFKPFVCGCLTSALSRPVCIAHAYIPVSVSVCFVVF